MLKSVDSFIAVSRYSAERFAAWLNVSKKQFFILPNCVDLNLFVPEARDVKLVERYGLRDNELILTVGRMASHARYNRFDEVIEATRELLRRFPSLKYMIVGDGDDRNRLEEKGKSLGLSEQIIFTGTISENEKVSYFCFARAEMIGRRLKKIDVGRAQERTQASVPSGNGLGRCDT